MQRLVSRCCFFQRKVLNSLIPSYQVWQLSTYSVTLGFWEGDCTATSSSFKTCLLSSVLSTGDTANLQRLAVWHCMATRVLKQQYVVVSNVLRTESKGWIWVKMAKICQSNIHWTTLSRGVSLVEVEMMHPKFSSGYRLNKLGQVVSPQNSGKHLASINLDRVKAAKLCVSNMFFSCWLRFWDCWWWSDLQKSKHRPRTRRPLLSTAATVADCSILNCVPARTRPLITFRTCVSNSSKASFSTMKRQNMNKRPGSLETTLLKRIMLLPAAIKNVKSSGNHGSRDRHSGYGYAHVYPQYNSDFVNKTLQFPKPVQGTASSKHVSGKLARCNLENLAVIRSSIYNIGRLAYK